MGKAFIDAWLVLPSTAAGPARPGWQLVLAAPCCDSMGCWAAV